MRIISLEMTENKHSTEMQVSVILDLIKKLTLFFISDRKQRKYIKEKGET